MKYLIDTDWATDHLRQVGTVSRRWEDLAPEGLALSIVSLAKIYEGVYYSRDPARSEEVLNQFLERSLLSTRRPASYSVESEGGCGNRR